VTKRIKSVEAIAERATGPSICLNMIVRNEAHIVEESLTCVLPFIDTWVIVDTGSSDGTQDLIRGFFEEHGVPGELHERPWVDFGHNRSEALALCAGKAEYAWVFDADDLVIGDIDLSGLTADSYLLQFGSEFTYWRTQIFGLSKTWEYRGVVHEYPVCLEPGATQERLEGNYHVESRRLGGRNRTGDKYERDSALLARALEADPNDTRSMFYLAQSRMDAGDLDGAYDYYTRRTQMGGWDEEVYYSHLQRARALERLGKPWEEVLGVYLHAWEFRPTRAEALVEISRHYRYTGEFNLGYHFAKLACEIPLPENDVLFVRADSYNWRRFDDRAICAFYLGKHQESFELCNQLLDGPFLPDSERTRILGNRDFVSEHILRQPPVHPVDIIAGIVDRQTNKPRKHPRVTLTITTCRRLDLFEQTMDSFLTHCLDRDQIDRWICIDDGSPAKDRRRMQERYPFFEFILKPRRDAGHARSLNMLRDEVSSPLWLHLEDDWRFFIDDHYVTRARAVLADDPSIAQVLFNRNYAEKLDDRDVGGGFPKRTEADRTPYRLHQHANPGTSEYHDAVNALPVGRGSNIWWPNFSLRPSIMRTKVIKKLGPFNEEADHFELDLARRFTAAGLRSAFFDKTTCVHLGPLSVDRGSDRRPNAYALNGQPQFGKRIASPTTVTKPINVRLVSNWASPEKLIEYFRRQMKAGDSWDEFTFTADPEAFEYTVVLNQPVAHELPLIHPAQTVVIPMEPSTFVPDGGSWATDDRKAFIQIRSHDRYVNPAEWHIDRSWSQLGGGGSAPDPIVKKHMLSAIVSGRRVDPGQILRLDFVHHLDKSDIELDVYGRDPMPNVDSYCGPLPFRDKSDGLFPYRYTFAAENNAEPNYVTEKLFDAVLAECLCFYWGCPNLEQILDPQVFIRLPLDDFDKSERVIRESMANNEWEKRLPVIRAEKQRIVDEIQLFPTIARALRGHRMLADLPIRMINLDRRTDRLERMQSEFARVGAETLAPNVGRFAAVDGQSLELTPEIEFMFRGNDFDFRRGIVACALSHVELWRDVAEGDGRPLLIFEDDVTLVDDFTAQLADVLGALQDRSDVDLVFLGYHRWLNAPAVSTDDTAPHLQPMQWEHFLGGTFAYVVTQVGARKLLEIVDRDGIQTGIDWLPLRHSAEMVALEVSPPLVSAQLAWPGRTGDSDIQHEFASLDTKKRVTRSDNDHT
jgi:GR25 family glycosyltransferase involved in LPS biosynthesis/glycosyltransferase involved in cell wall biosynthesis